jgi:hypothetical protein
MIQDTLFHAEDFLEPYGFLNANSILDGSIFRANITIGKPADDGRITFLHTLCAIHLDSQCVESEPYQSAKTDVANIQEWLFSSYVNETLPKLHDKEEVSHALIKICVYNDYACITKGLDNYAAEEYYYMTCTKGFNLPNDICNTGELGHEGL